MQWDDYSIIVKSIGNMLESEKDPPPGRHVKMLVASLPCGLSLIKHGLANIYPHRPLGFQYVKHFLVPYSPQSLRRPDRPNMLPRGPRFSGPHGRHMGHLLYLSCYRHCRIRNRKEIASKTLAFTSSPPTYPFLSPQLSPWPKVIPP